LCEIAVGDELARRTHSTNGPGREGEAHNRVADALARARVIPFRSTPMFERLTLRSAAIASLLATCAFFGLVSVADAQTAAQNRVVMQVSDADPAKWNLALNNARNLQADLGAANVEIEIVAYGPGIGMLKAGSVVGDRIDDAVKSGVKVLACENTMRGQKLVRDDMLNGIGYVSAGVVEIMQRQQQGWAYLRP
jgi:intracellular sulfur oxidation DsrE/DsrF family protein